MARVDVSSFRPSSAAIPDRYSSILSLSFAAICAGLFYKLPGEIVAHGDRVFASVVPNISVSACGIAISSTKSSQFVSRQPRMMSELKSFHLNQDRKRSF
jgi:hypothetical protein